MRGRRLLAVLCATLALTACNGGGDVEDDDVDVEADASVGASGDTGSVSPSAAVAATASHDSPDGAMAGLLAAMRTGDVDQTLEWVSPEPSSDRDSITQTSRMGAMLGLDGALFWLVDERRVVNVTSTGEDSADVRLDGYLVWCTGGGADDPKASCAQPNGSGDTQTTTYPAVRVGGQWYVHLDLNHGELIQGNPGRSGVAG
jgi:hypothetical protein